MPVVAVFEQHASEYDAWFDAHAFVYQAEVAALRKLTPGGGLSLEVGIGTGRFAVPLGILCGIDPSRRMLAIARQRSLRVCQAVGEQLPFREGLFDVVLLVTVICFVDDVPILLRELRRVLKSGGHLIIGFINRNSELGRLYESRKETGSFYRDARFYSVEEVAGPVQEAGLRSLRFCETLLGDPEKLGPRGLEVRDGYANGAFVVLRAQKT
ncbi:class I SAM-dependent methyltransferase [Candidatus Nitrospira bockiana]